MSVEVKYDVVKAATLQFYANFISDSLHMLASIYDDQQLLALAAASDQLPRTCRNYDHIREDLRGHSVRYLGISASKDIAFNLMRGPVSEVLEHAAVLAA